MRTHSIYDDHYLLVLGRRLRRRREAAGVTRKVLSEQVDMSSKALEMWENGERCPNLLLIMRLAHALQWPIEQLIYGTEDEWPELLPRNSIPVYLSGRRSRTAPTFAVACAAAATPSNQETPGATPKTTMETTLP